MAENKNPQQQPTNTSETKTDPKTLLEVLDFLDKKLSGWIHSCVVKPRFLELIILPFAFLFQPYVFPLLIGTVGVFLPILE